MSMMSCDSWCLDFQGIGGTSVTIYKTTGRHELEDDDRYPLRRENLKSQTSISVICNISAIARAAWVYFAFFSALVKAAGLWTQDHQNTGNYTVALALSIRPHALSVFPVELICCSVSKCQNSRLWDLQPCSSRSRKEALGSTTMTIRFY
jgi:hypothetical protein